MAGETNSLDSWCTVEMDAHYCYLKISYTDVYTDVYSDRSSIHPCEWGISNVTETVISFNFQSYPSPSIASTKNNLMT